MKKSFIQKSESPAEYLILFVSKKDESLQLCVDYHKLNDITIKNWYSLFNINELQDWLAEATIFITLNLQEVYNLIKMKVGKKWKTAFRIRYDHYEYKVMLFDLINASVTCQQMINDVLRDLLNVTVIAYLDDILIFFKDFMKYENHVR